MQEEIRMTTRQIKRLQGSCCICLPEVDWQKLLMDSEGFYCYLGKLAPGRKLVWLEQFFWSAGSSELPLQSSVGRSRL